MNLSVVIPVFHEMRLERTILRLRQTCPDLPELVLVFDGDDPENYVIDYPQELLLIVHHPERKGTSMARHAGTVAATNATIFSTDGHVDWLDGEGWAEKLVELSEQHPFDILCCKCMPVDLNNMRGQPGCEPYHGATLRLRKKLGARQWALDKDWDTAQEGIIPLIMGAAYTYQRRRYLDDLQSPWTINFAWGNDEQTLSLVNWICGGESRLVDVVIAHQMGVEHVRRDGNDLTLHMASNRLSLIRALPMDQYRRQLLEWWIVDEPSIAARIHEVEATVKHNEVKRLRDHLEKQPRTFDDFVERFNCPDVDQDEYGLRKSEALFINPVFKAGIKSVPADRQISLTGLPRSGTHVMADWIASQIAGDIRYATSINMGGRHAHEESFNRKNHFSLPSMPRNRRTGPKTFLYSFERMHPSSAAFLPWIKAKSSARVLLIRSFHNWAASFVRNTHPNMEKEDLRTLWLTFAQCWVEAGADTVCIYYDRFVSDPAYRDQVAARLNVDDRTDGALDKVSNYGRGSSFDGVRFDGHALDMDVNNRWQEYADEPWMQRFRRDVEINQLLELVINKEFK